MPVTPVLATNVAMNITDSTHFGQLLEPKLRKVFFETYDEVPEQFSKVFNVKTSKKRMETDYGIGAFKPWTERGSKVSEVTYQQLDPGLERTYVHKAFMDGFMITKEDADDELYGVIEKMPKALARSGRSKVEMDAITVLNNAFSKDVGGVGLSAIYDGKPLIAANHALLSGGTTSNLVTGDLADTTLKQALILSRDQKDEAGGLIQMKFDTLVVPPELEFAAYELIKSSQKVGSNFNDINSLQGRLNVVVLDYLTDSNAWFIMDSKRHELNFFWRVDSLLAA